MFRVRPRPHLALLVVGLVLTVAACGSAPGPSTPSPTPKPTGTSPAPSPSPTPTGGTAEVDLPVAATGEVCGGQLATPGSVRIGTIFFNPVEGCPTPQIFRGFLAFTMGPIPQGAQVVSATLTTARSQTGVPYAVTGQRLLVEAVAWFEDGSLDPQDFNTPALEGSQALVAASTTGDVLEVDVTDLVRRSLESGLANAGFRFRFALEPVPPGTLNNVERLSSPFGLRVTYQP